MVCGSCCKEGVGLRRAFLFGDAFRVQGRSDFLALAIIIAFEGIVKVSLLSCYSLPKHADILY
jgi:hypothetical protein